MAVIPSKHIIVRKTALLPKDLLDELELMAARNCRSLQGEIRYGLRLYVQSEQRRQARQNGTAPR